MPGWFTASQLSHPQRGHPQIMCTASAATPRPLGESSPPSSGDVPSGAEALVHHSVTLGSSL